MNCVNCGAPMELFARRRYYFCRHCGRFHFLEARDVDGLQVLNRPHDALKCSMCAGALAKGLIDQAYTVEYCEQCRGVLMARPTFAEIVMRRRAWASGTPVEPLPLDRAELERQLPCPACRGWMEVHPYYGPGNIVIDSCGTCDLVWLDFGELQQIVDAPGRDRGTRDFVPPLEPRRIQAKEERVADGAAGRLDLLEVLRHLFS